MRQSHLLALSIRCAALVAPMAVQPATARAQADARYRIETRADRAGSLQERFSESQLALLEKLNRADIGHLEQLREFVVPELWSDELSYSVLPTRYVSSETWPTFLVVYLPGQLFGAYEFGSLLRWGPVSSGSRSNPTAPRRFALNWRSTGRASTVDPTERDAVQAYVMSQAFREHPGLTTHVAAARVLTSPRCRDATSSRRRRAMSNASCIATRASLCRPSSSSPL